MATMFRLGHVPLEEQRSERFANENFTVRNVHQLRDLIAEVADSDLELIGERLEPFGIWVEAGLLPVHRSGSVNAHLLGELVDGLEPASDAQAFDLSPDVQVHSVAPTGAEPRV